MCSSENLVGSLSIGVIIGGLDTSAKIRLIPYSGKSVVIGKVSHCLHLLLVLLYIAFCSYQRNHVAIYALLSDFCSNTSMHSGLMRSKIVFSPFRFIVLCAHNFPPLTFKGIST